VGPFVFYFLFGLNSANWRVFPPYLFLSPRQGHIFKIFSGQLVIAIRHLPSFCFGSIGLPRFLVSIVSHFPSPPLFPQVTPSLPCAGGAWIFPFLEAGHPLSALVPFPSHSRQTRYDLVRATYVLSGSALPARSEFSSPPSYGLPRQF